MASIFATVLLGIFPWIRAWKNSCHCAAMTPPAVASFAFVVRASIPITINSGKSARVMGVSFWSCVVGRWFVAKPALPQRMLSAERRNEANRRLKFLLASESLALANDQQPTTNDQRPTPVLFDFHDFFFFRFAHLFHLLDFVVSELLNLFHGAFFFVFSDLLVLQRFLNGIVAVAADVADGGAMLLEDFVQMLHHFPAALFGQSWDRNANDLSVIHGI